MDIERKLSRGKPRGRPKKGTTKPKTLSNYQIRTYAENLHGVLKNKDLDNEYEDVLLSWDGKNVIMTTQEGTFRNHDVLVVLKNFIDDFNEDEQEPFIY